MQFVHKNIIIQPLPSMSQAGVEVAVLRLDQWHNVVSGNKWFKLKYQLQAAIQQGCDTVATFGGAYSNHLVATAFACKELGLQSIGIVRGEEPETYSHTLQHCKEYGMQLQFVSRQAFQQKETVKQTYNGANVYWVDEGGYSVLGMQGAADILSTASTQAFTHIACACGTGTMLAGLIHAALPHQQVIGISVLKGHTSLQQEVNALLPLADHNKPYTLLHDYHFGGYAKHPQPLLQYMQQLWQQEQLPTDIVYTAKLCYAVQDLVGRQYFPAGSKVLIIHSGGLQGNLSLPLHTLSF